MKHAKQLLLLVAMTALLTVLLCVVAGAEIHSGTCGAEGDGSNLTWTLDTETGELTISGEGAMAEYTGSSKAPWYTYRSHIEKVTLSKGITSIGAYAFSECSALREIVIPEGVKSIGFEAFYSCSSLEEITLLEGLNSIGIQAFLRCSSLKKVIFPNTLTRIESRAFSDCRALAEIEIPKCVKSIGTYAFANCVALVEIVIPEGVESIGDFAFSGCSSLESMTVPFVGAAKNAASASENTLFGYLFGTVSYTGSVATKQRYAWDSDITYYIPASLKSVTVTGGELYYGAFYNCSNLTSIILGDGVTGIGSRAFRNCEGLESIQIPSGVMRIGEEAFLDCSNLRFVEILSKEADIYSTKYTFDNAPFIHGYKGSTAEAYATEYARVFEDIENPVGIVDSGMCGADGDNLSWKITTKGELVISGSGKMKNYDNTWSLSPWISKQSYIKKVTIENGVTNIGNYAFYGCTGFSEICIPSSVTSIGNGAFYHSGLTKIEIPSNVTTIDRYTFSESSLVEVEIPDTVTSVGDYVFQGCKSLERVTVGNGVTSLNGWFGGCTALESVTIGNGVTKITGNAFSDCENLTGVYITDLAKWCAISFDYASSNPLYYAKNLYLNGELVTKLTIPDGVKTISKYAFNYCTSLTELTVPEGVSSIYNEAFNGCSNLAVIKILSKTVGISTSNQKPTFPEHSFIYGYKGSTAETFAKNNGYFFVDIEGVKDVAYSGECGAEGNNISWQMTTKGELIISGNGAMMDYSSGYDTPWRSYGDDIKKVTFKGAVTHIGDSAFDLCSSLTSVNIPNTVTSIGADAFSRCRALTELVLPESVTSIGAGAFYQCSLAEIEIPSGVISIGDEAFRCSTLAFAKILTKTAEIGNAFLTTCFIHGYKDSTAEANATQYGLFFEDIENPKEIAYSGIFGTEGASYNKEGKNLSWKVTTKGELIISGNGGMRAYDDVVGRCMPWYSCRLYIKKAIVEEGVQNIGDYAFWDCRYLTDITFPSSIVRIGYNAFSSCTSLANVHIVDMASWCGIFFESTAAHPMYYAKNLYLKGSLVTKLSIPESVTSIGQYAFYNCKGITEVEIPSGVTSIGEGAFTDCTGLEGVYLTDIKKWCEISFASMTSNPLFYAKNLYLRNGLLTKLRIPNGVTNIGNYAFYNCSSLTEVTVPNGVTSIGKYALYNCSRLTEISISNSVTSIGDCAFYGCSSLADITIPNGVTSIGSSVFSKCTSLTEVRLPDSVTSIGYSAFESCIGLTEIIIPSSVKEFGNYVFRNTSLTNVYITDMAAWCGISFSQDYANPLFDAKRLYLNGSLVTKLNVPEGVTAIADYAFCGYTELADLSIPGSVTSIGRSAFSGCEGLAGEIHIPNSITSIGIAAFADCRSLSGVYITDMAAWCSILFDNDSANPLSCARNLYLNGILVTKLSIPEGVKNVGNYAFSGGTSFTELCIPDSVTAIGNYAFNDCGTIERVIFGENSGLLLIGEYAFNNCRILAEFKIPEGVTSIGKSAFWDCEGLTEICIPDSVTKIDDGAFTNCHGLEKITVLAKTVTIYNNSSTLPTGATIYGYRGSTAEAYATKYNRTFVVLCNHVYEDDWLKDENGHWQTCSECGTETDAAEHIYDNACDGLCDTCGYIRIAPHNYKTTWDKDENSHYYMCADCGDKKDVNAHGYDNVCDADCDTCGYVRVAPHDYKAEWTTSETEHWYECSLCGDKKDGAEHIYDNACDGLCDTCGYTRVAPHAYKSEWVTNRDSHWHECADCELKKDEAEHIYDDSEDVICNVCEYERTLYTLGDVNDDGKVDSNDAIYLLRYTLQPSSYPINQIGDMNGDGKVDSNDAIYLLRHTLQPSQYPLEKSK